MSESVSRYFQERHGLDPAMLQRVLAEAMGRGGDFADVYVEYRRSTSLQLEESLLKSSDESISLGAGVRVLSGEQTGYAYSNDLTREKLLEAARTASAIAEGPARGAVADLSSRQTPQRYTVEQVPADVDFKVKMDLLRAADEAARSADSRVREVRASWSDENRLVWIANSDGELVADEQPLFTFSVSAVAEANGDRQSGSKNIGLRAGMEAFSPELAQTLAREAVEQAATLLSAGDAPAGEFPIVLAAGSSGVLLHESVGHPLEADANRKKLSVFSESLGETVATGICTVVDDATLPGLRGSLNMDGEGTVPRKPTVMIERGVLKAYLQDRLSARLMKLPVTGNGRRADYRSIPIPRMTNTFLAAGEDDPEDIVRSVDNGIYCVAFSGGQVEPAAGKFTFSVHEGYRIENGKITKPIKGATLIGSGSEILQHITAVGNDLELHRGTWTCGKAGQGAPVGVGTPTVKISRMTVGGVS